MRIELQRLLALGNCLFNWPAKTYALHRLVLTMTRCRIERTSLELLCNGSFVSSLRTCRCTRALLPPCSPAVVIRYAFEKPLCLVCLARQHRPVRRANTRCQLRALAPVHLRFIHRTFDPVLGAVVDDSAVDPVLGHYQHLV